MLKEETIGFLRSVPPLSFLTAEDLEAITEDIGLEYYPKGVKVLSQDGPPSEHLRIIKKGGVKVFMNSDEGNEIVIDYRSEGEHFGLLSVVSGDRSRANVVAVEDTICYQIPKDKVLDIIQRNPSVNEFFLKSFFINFIDKTYQETRKRCYSGNGLVDTERLLFTTTVGDIVTREPVTAQEETPIRDSAGIMARNRISSLVIVNHTGLPVGIVTDRDLREKVVARGRDLREPVGHIMSSPLIKVDAEEYCFEALLKLMRFNIHHILVVEKGRFKGVVTNHDFMVLQGSSPTVLVKEMAELQSLESLGRTAPKLYKTVSTLLREGARAQNVTGLITELSEKLINRVSDMIEKKIGPPPIPYALFIFGDGGRRELTLNLNIRAGIVFDDPANLPLQNSAEKYFSEFTGNFNEFMARYRASSGRPCIEAAYAKSLTDWRDFFDRWGTVPGRISPDAELFDLRAVRGEERVAEELREHLFKFASSNEELMDLMATLTVSNRPPLGFFKRFVVEKTGEHKNELDIYEKGIVPIAGSVRIFSIEKGHIDLPTIRRLKELKGRHSFELASDISHAFEYLLALLVHNQLVQIENGQEPDSFINPETLSTLERKTLKESFQLIAALYDIIEKSYRTERVSQ